MNGGYYMINWDNNIVPLDSELSVTITGIYDSVVSAIKLNKPVLIYNVSDGNDGIMTPIDCAVVYSDSTYMIVIPTYNVAVSVSSEDVVTPET